MTTPTRWQLLGYSQLALPVAGAGLPLYLHAPAYYANNVGLSLSTIGVLLLGMRIMDAIQDPLIGYLSDRYPTYRKYLLNIGLVLLGTGMWLVFHPASQSPAAWFAFSILISTTGYSIVSIHLQALGGLWATNDVARTSIHSWREGMGLIGVLLAASLPSVLGSDHAPADAFNQYTLFNLGLLLCAGVGFSVWLRTVPLYSSTRQRATLALTTILASAWQRRFFAIYLGNSIAAALPAVLVLFYIQDRLQAEEYSGLYLVLYFISGAVGMPIWQSMAQRYGKTQVWLISMVLATLTFSFAAQLGAGDYLAYGAVCVLSGLALGADLALPPAILADRIAQQQHYAQIARYYSLLTLLNKAALALAAGIALPLLSQLGYQPGTTAPNATQALGDAYTLLPCGIKIIVACALWRHQQRATAWDYSVY